MYLFLALGLLLLYFVQRFENWLEATHPTIYYVSGAILVTAWVGMIIYCVWSNPERNK